MALLIAAATATVARGQFSISHEELRSAFLDPKPRLQLPLPDGSTRTFSLSPNGLLSADSTQSIRTLSGESLEDAACKAHVVLTKRAFTAQIFSRAGTHYLESRSGATSIQIHISDWRAQDRVAYQCLTAIPDEQPAGALQRATATEPSATPNVYRRFRLAPAATGEFTDFHGSKEDAVFEVVTAMTRANGIFHRELGISFQLVPGFEQMIFNDPETDPYSSNNPSEQLLIESQNAFDQFIGTENYDLGILLTRGQFGLTYFSSVCNPAQKGMSCIGLPEPKGDAFHVNLVTHELAHQFGAKHTFNSPTGLCAERRDGFTAFEPASGSTLMSYASLPCEGDSFQSYHDDYFHSQSLKQILDFVNSSRASCAQVTPRENTAPDVNTNSEFIIPTRTPFALTASGSDAEGDTIFYCWEQRDLGPARTLAAPDDGLGPLFRSFYPTTNSTRLFPRLELILAGEDAPEERLPTLPRIMKFRVTVRDSHNDGAVDWADVRMQVIDTGAPFKITSHNSAVTLSNTAVLTWDVAGTTNSPINATNVSITLSTNAGASFDIVLAASTENDGAEEIALPELVAEDVRIKVQPTNNIFFDINDAPLKILRSASTPTNVVTLGAALLSTNKIELSWKAEVNAEYILQRATNLPAARWLEVLRTNATSTNISVNLTANGINSFYRVILP